MLRTMLRILYLSILRRCRKYVYFQKIKTCHFRDVACFHCRNTASARGVAGATRGRRVIIHAFGEKLAFREKDAGRIGFRWFYGHEQCLPNYGANLALWLNDPKMAECMNRVIPDDLPSDPLINLSIQVRSSSKMANYSPGRSMGPTSLKRGHILVT